MNDFGNENEGRRNACELDVWENEGGSLGRDSMNHQMDHQYGRRVESDRSWTVYHVFTGVPARAGGSAMINLSRSAATDRMLCLNSRNAGRRKERARETACTGPAQ